ncbi:MAG: dipeptidase [Candidatus Promineifilaceae bacterium]
MIQSAVEYAHVQHDRFLEDFFALLRIPSISTDSAYVDGIHAAGDWLIAEMTRIGFDNAQALATDGHPIIYGDWLHAGDDKPTVLVYAHYDVQPVEPVSRWATDPFEPTIIDGKIYARGAMDDKCGCIVSLKTFEAMLATAGTLPLNVKIFFEGEEESGSPGMEAALDRYRELLSADLLVISDGGPAPDQPYIISSVRGIIDGQVTVTSCDHDLHSGKFGGVVHNPTHKVAEIIAAMHDRDGRILIPGFYEGVVGASSAEKASFAQIEDDFKAFQQRFSGAKAFWGDPRYSHIERVASQPTCDVNGIWGGYQGKGLMTIIPAKAGFKVSMRMVANQDPQVISEKFVAFINSFNCDTVEIEVEMFSASHAAKMLDVGPVVDALQAAYGAVWGQSAVILGMGGSVPITGMFARQLGMPITMFGFGVGDGQHAPNEYLFLEHFGRGIDTAIHFYYQLADKLS